MINVSLEDFRYCLEIDSLARVNPEHALSEIAHSTCYQRIAAAYNHAPVDNRKLIIISVSNNSVQVQGEPVRASDLGLEELPATTTPFSSDDLARIQAMLCQRSLADIRRCHERFAERERRRERNQVHQAIEAWRSERVEKKPIGGRKHRHPGEPVQGT